MGARRAKSEEQRLLIFPIATAIIFLVLIARLWYFHVVKAEELRRKGERQQQSRIPRLAPRGLVLDRNGVVLAGIRSELVMTAVPAEVRKQPWSLRKAAEISGAEEERLRAKANDGNWRPWLPQPVHLGLSAESAVRIAESAQDMPGIGIASQPVRFYPDPTGFTHVLGYVAAPNERDEARLSALGLNAASFVGKTGLEREYESELMGKPGVKSLEVNAKRRPIRLAADDQPTPGARLILSIDARLQKAATLALRGRRGGAVALDPRTGEVLCLVSSPSYDLGLFQGGISHEEYRRLTEGDLPELNRAIYASYQPGSTFKVVTALAAYRRGELRTHTTVSCPGFFQLGRWKTRCLGKHGALGFEEAMAVSCNTYFATLAYRSGEEALRQAALDLGLGQETGVDLPGEGEGIIPTEDWILKRRKPPVWRPGDTVNMGIGQGDVLATPIQMASLIAAVAMSGERYSPRVARRIESPEGWAKNVEPPHMESVVADEEFWSRLRAALEGVVDHGTARSGQIAGLRWAGKTGSAEHLRGRRTHGWFIGYAPADNPRIALAVVVEAAGHGGTVALPVAKAMVQAYLSASEATAKKESALVSASTASLGRPAAR